MRRLFAPLLTAIALLGMGSTAFAQTEGESAPSARAYFKDTYDFTFEELKKGRNCFDIDKGVRVNFKFVAWPQRFGAYLAEEAGKFPLFGEIADQLQGIYLVRIWRNGVLETNFHGATCQVGENGKYVVFMDYDTIVRPRRYADRRDWRSYSSQTLYPPVRHHPGDLGLVTLFHELFHVVDNVRYLSALIDPTREGAAEAIKEREELWSTSWTSITDSLYPETTRRRGVDLHRYTERDTNFVNPAAGANVLEDFAYTLDAYYLGTRYDIWPAVEYYAPNLLNQPLYTFSTEHLLKFSQAHIKKTCLYVEKVLGEECRINSIFPNFDAP